MPFDPPFPRNFSSAGVRMHAPPYSGVYGVSNARQWIYIGESDNIQAALLQHLQEMGTDLLGMQPTGFVFETCDRAARAQRQDRLVREYEPACNRRWGQAR